METSQASTTLVVYPLRSLQQLLTQEHEKMTDKSAICVVTKSYDCGRDVGPEGQAGGHRWGGLKQETSKPQTSAQGQTTLMVIPEEVVINNWLSASSEP